MMATDGCVARINQGTSAHIRPDAIHDYIFTRATSPTATGVLASLVVTTAETAIVANG